MNKHVNNLLPFYVNGTLTVEKRAFVNAHLAACPSCGSALKEWEELATRLNHLHPSREETVSEARQAAGGLPALSPVVRANLQGKPSIPEAVRIAAHLIGAQRMSLKQGWLVTTFTILLLAWVSAALATASVGSAWAVYPLLILVPFVAALGVGFLDPLEDDPAYEILAATPTSPGVLFFARLTLALGAIAGLAMLGSFLISAFGRVSLFGLVAVWLGPMLWLSALTTLLALVWGPWAAAGASIALWGGIVLLLFTELSGISPLGFSLSYLLHPSWLSFGGQVFLAGILWLANSLWLFRGTPPSLRMERGG